MICVPVPRLRGLAFALDVITRAETTARAIANKVEAALGTESPIVRDLRSLAWRLGEEAEIVEAGNGGNTEE